MPSTRDTSTLPGVNDLRRHCQSLALLDAILQPEWDFRYFSFNAHWSPGEQMASMRDGSGDGYFILFNDAGAIMKGFAHESQAWSETLERGHLPPGSFDGVPSEFAGFLTEPAFSMEETTFCLWRLHADPSWKTGPLEPSDHDDPDGSAELLWLLDGDPSAYRSWAEDYFETPVAAWAVEHVFAHRPIDEALVKCLNPDLTLADLAEDLAEIGYPDSGTKA